MSHVWVRCEGDGMTRGTARSPVRYDTILLVDDEADILDSMSELLEDLGGIRVLKAHDGQAGLKILEHGGIDLIISDYRMPKMDGLEFLGRAHDIAPDVPRIMMTAFPDLNVAMDGINEAQIHNFFTKPMDPEKVIDVVWQILDERWEALEKKAMESISLDKLRRHNGPGHITDE